MPRKINDKLLLERHAAGASGLELATMFNCSPAAISKRLSRLVPSEPSAIDKLTPKQAAVVKRIAAGESPTNAVSVCYDVTTRASASEISRRLMAAPDVQLALDEEMNRAGLTRKYRVTKLAKHCEADDPAVSLKALDMSFRLADEFPAIKSKTLSVNVDVSPVDLSKFGFQK